MFEAFTADARKVMALANQAAQRTWHNYILPAHIMYGVLGLEEGRGNRTLNDLAVDRKAFRARLLAELEATGDADTFEYPPKGSLAPNSAKRAIEAAVEECRRLGDSCVGTDHLLLGLVAVSDPQLAALLRGAGVPDLEALRQFVGDRGPRLPDNDGGV